MIEQKRKREIRANIHHDIITAILANTNGDEEFLFALLNAQNYISNAILNFDDIFDEIKKILDKLL